MNKLFVITLVILLSLPVRVQAVDNILDSTGQETVVTAIEDELKSETQVEKETQFKQPISKRKIAKKFLVAMGGVTISSLALFFLLTLYNKIREGCIGQTKTLDGEISLETPCDIDSAIKTFLDKTDWKG